MCEGGPQFERLSRARRHHVAGLRARRGPDWYGRDDTFRRLAGKPVLGTPALHNWTVRNVRDNETAARSVRAGRPRA